ncbi:MAG: DeoR family transcriptional regulator, partial [Deltaproteobacteria bacterium]
AKDSIEELLSTLSETTFEDGYSRACLLAELSHQYLLRGNAVKAKETLNSACEYVYRIENLRLEILLNFRIAVMLSQQGELSQALHLVRGSLKRLEEKVDRHLELKLKGLEQKLLGKLGHLEQCESLSKEVYELTRRTGYFTANRIWGRTQGRYLSSEVRLQDPLGDMFDDIEQGNQELIQEVIERNWLGLLYPLCKIDVTTRTLLLGLSGKSLTVFDQGNVHHFSRGASNQVSKFLSVLSQGRKTKEQIIHEVWQEKYHPLRHDPLLYTLISKLRKELGNQAAWVEASQEGYELQAGVVVREFEKALKPSQSVSWDNSESVVPLDQGLLELNFRQQQIVSLARKSSYIDVKALGEAFQVSPATANRDLAFLEDQGWLIRTGKGRATRFHFGRKDEKHESN